MASWHYKLFSAFVVLCSDKLSCLRLHGFCIKTVHWELVTCAYWKTSRCNVSYVWSHSATRLWATRVPRMKCKLAPISRLSAASEDESSECSAVCNSGGRVAAYYLYCCTLWLLHGSWYCRIYWMSFRWTVNRPQYWSRDEQWWCYVLWYKLRG